MQFNLCFNIYSNSLTQKDKKVKLRTRIFRFPDARVWGKHSCRRQKQKIISKLGDAACARCCFLEKQNDDYYLVVKVCASLHPLPIKEKYIKLCRDRRPRRSLTSFIAVPKWTVEDAGPYGRDGNIWFAFLRRKKVLSNA